MMEKLRSDQFTVMIIPPATSYGPVDGRKYTLSGIDSEISKVLSIGSKYNLNKYPNNREDVFIAEWLPKLGEYVLSGELLISREGMSEADARNRYERMLSELPNMLATIFQADHSIFKYAPWLMDAPIFVQCDSHIPYLCTLKQMGTPRNYF
ncbi:MAG TPA: staygreen family protein [Bacillaceae bacterium]|nr:staygreen family protein [Bacillaceae bacterium]